MEYLQLVAVVTLLTSMLFHGGDCFNVVDIILWSNGSSVASGQSVNGLSVDVVNGSNTTLQAVAVTNESTSTFEQLQFDWYKDGTSLKALPKFRQRIYDLKLADGAVQMVDFSLPIAAVNGNKSGNYSLFFRTVDNGGFFSVTIVAFVVVTVGEAQRPAFTAFPGEMTNCSSTNSSTVLSYATTGFPRPVYTLRCSGMQYESQPSALGNFVVPPDVCCVGAQCIATAYNNYHEPVDSLPTRVKQHPQSSSCAQRISDLSPRLVFLLQSQSWTPATSQGDLNGKIVEVISTDVNAMLEASYYQHVSAFIQLQLRFLKDGGTIDSLSMTSRVCNGSLDWGSWMSCSLHLPLFSINGNLSGNYSVELRQANATDIIASAWVMVIVDEFKPPNFTVVPKRTISCSSGNQSTILNYVAVGFPKPVYKLRCYGVQYESGPSTSGQFIVPPEVCCLGSYCVASADNGYVSPVDSRPTIAKDLSVNGSCQQHKDCLSPGVDIFLKSCTTNTYGSALNGKTIDVAADDLSVTLEALSYQKSTLTQLHVIWSKDSRKLDVSDGTPARHCEGNEEWGSWTRCGFRLPLAALKGNLSGNYSVELRQDDDADLLASAWLVINASTQGLSNCSTTDVTQTYPYYVSTTFPNTCTARCVCASPPLESRAPESIHFVMFPPHVIDATVTIDNSTLILSYAAAGIAANVSVTYTLHCSNSKSDVNFAPVSLNSGNFTAPAPPCRSNTSCYATVSHGTESSVDSPVTLLIGRPICPAAAIGSDSLPYIISTASVVLVVVTAVFVIVLYCRMRKIRMLAALKGRSGDSNVNAEPFSEHGASAGIQSSSSHNITRDSLLCEQKPYYLYRPFKLEVNGEDLLETDGGSASLAVQSSFIDVATSQVDQRDRYVKPGLQSSAARLPVVADAAESPSFSCPPRRLSTLVVINAQNVQLGSGNTMVINSNSSCTRDSLGETDYCTASLASEDCDTVSEKSDAHAPMSYQLELDSACDSVAEAEFSSALLTSEGWHVASEKSGTQATTNYHPQFDDDCDVPLQCASSDLTEHYCAAALPAVSPDLAL